MESGTALLTDAQVTAITGALKGFGTSILDAFIQILPALAVIAAIWFVISLIRSKVN